VAVTTVLQVRSTGPVPLNVVCKQEHATRALAQPMSADVFEGYRYDPLGRRAAVRTRRPAAICNQPAECYNSITWFVWAGDQLLWEIRETEGTSNTDAGGQVSYFQAGGIDRPLTIWKQDVGTIVTHQSWRGQFARGTFGEGPRAGESSDCEEYPPTNGCLPVRWPGWNTSAWSQEAAREETTGSDEFWFGSLSVGMRDASGQQYMRNRYYNPQTGQFTQPDPIGLAGGLNSYGFAAGDPVSYSDPYGLCPKEMAEISPMMCTGYDIMHTFMHGPTLPEEPYPGSGMAGDAGLR
jgi:RHS repeat-associated protein